MVRKDPQAHYLQSLNFLCYYPILQALFQKRKGSRSGPGGPKTCGSGSGLQIANIFAKLFSKTFRETKKVRYRSHCCQGTYMYLLKAKAGKNKSSQVNRHRKLEMEKI
jgi:hypothetical protein